MPGPAARGALQGIQLVVNDIDVARKNRSYAASACRSSLLRVRPAHPGPSPGPGRRRVVLRDRGPQRQRLAGAGGRPERRGRLTRPRAGAPIPLAAGVAAGPYWSHARVVAT